MRMRRPILSLAVLVSLAYPVYAQDTQPLFVIERSANKNVVHYDAQIARDGTLDPKEPVIAYWIMLANGGHREELNFLERQLAYGFTIQPDPGGRGYRMALAADREREITVYQKDDKVAAEIMIAGRPAILTKLSVDSTDGGVLPSVNYIELFGRDLKSGEERYEKIMPNR
jgi:hypothetical protein